MAEVIVDRLQSVEVEIQDRDGSGASRRESFGKLRNNRSTIVQTGQIVMLSLVAKPFFGGDAGLELCKQSGDRAERVHLFLLPLPATKVNEAKDTGGHPFETSGAAAIEGVATRRLPVVWRWKAL